MSEDLGFGRSKAASRETGAVGATPLADEALAEFLCPDDLPVGRQIVAKLTPEKRAAYERLSELCVEIDLWSNGLGPKPTGAILCGPKQVRGAGIETARQPKRSRARAIAYGPEGVAATPDDTREAACASAQNATKPEQNQ